VVSVSDCQIEEEGDVRTALLTVLLAEYCGFRFHHVYSIVSMRLIARTRSDAVPMFVNDCVNYVISNVVAFYTSSLQYTRLLAIARSHQSTNS